MSTHIEAPAKLTLSLRVTDVRNDGYHLIDAQMVSLLLCDHITVSPSSTTKLSITGPHASHIPTDSSNLAVRALQLVDTTAQVVIEKNIPAGGGLGGGSTDAAALLRWAQYSDLNHASRLGADIPFCMIGGRAQVSGIGEMVSPLPYIHSDITLIIPPLHVSTPAVYAMWDQLGGPHHESGNDLEPAAIAVQPELAEWKNRITEACGQSATLAGSGATWWVEGHHPQLEKLQGAIVIFTSTRPDAGAITPDTA